MKLLIYFLLYYVLCSIQNFIMAAKFPEFFWRLLIVVRFSENFRKVDNCEFLMFLLLFKAILKKKNYKYCKFCLHFFKGFMIKILEIKHLECMNFIKFKFVCTVNILLSGTFRTWSMLDYRNFQITECILEKIFRR